MECPVFYTTPKESYSKKAEFISQSEATPGPRKKKNRKSTKTKLLRGVTCKDRAKLEIGPEIANFETLSE